MHRASVAPSFAALVLALAGTAAAQQVQVGPLTGAASAQASAAHLVRESGGGSLALYQPKTPRPAAGFPTIVVVPGHDCTPTDYTIVRDQLLRRGFGVALFALGDNSELAAERWDDRLELLVSGLLAEARRPGSPLLGSVDGAKLGIVGHSLGGAVATLRAARDPRWKALVVFGPGGQDEGFLSEARSVRGATLAIDAGLDRITPPATHGGRVVERSASPHKAQVVIEGGAHPNAPADFDADYIREPKLVSTPLPFWPFLTWSYEFPIVPGVTPIPSATQRAIAFRYLLPWLERFVAGRSTTAIREATDGRRARRDVADGVLSKATFSPALATATTTGLAGGVPNQP